MVEQAPDIRSQQEPSTGFLAPSAVTSAAASLTIKGQVSPQAESSARSVASRKRLNVQYRYSPVKSQRGCLKYAIPNNDVVWDEEGFKGVQTCDSSMCFVCGYKKQARNSEKLGNIIQNTLGQYEYSLVTLTIPTSSSVYTQARVLQKAYNRTIKSVRKTCKRIGTTFEVSWANDITIDPKTMKVHLHRHAIARLPKGHNLDIDRILFTAWERAVRASNGGDVVRSAYYFQPVEEVDKAVQYIFKAATEAMASQSKVKSWGNRIGWYGLADTIMSSTGEVKDKLVEVYRNIVLAMKGKRWFGLSNKMNDDFVEIVDCEDDTDNGQEKLEERKITIGTVQHAIHAAMCDSGYLWVLDYVLKNLKDGDKEVEILKSIVFQYNHIDDKDLFWQNEKNYRVLVELFSRWGRECVSSIDTLNKPVLDK